ncbi:hypothetical protein BDB00DRAFT_607547 [Zychaea mexicana]|uniref:uncharacterized protein n=1 Tax=Zychaea mexicana TaxID=64656 RepID=UPI0022FF31AC|nr:uncharacterized protein BDB00DRAFT_607547 [Zychaea mexicana]KAI9489545.1 hypothetical protein BDB00DRAFT_607547 [Zychaea mexicana]
MVPASQQQHVSATVANVACITLPFIYVAGFYLFLDEKNAKLSRNHPVIIRNRIKSVTLASIVAAILVWLIVPFASLNYSIFQALGLSLPSSVPELVALTGPVVLTTILFLGPLVQLFFEQSLPFQSNFDFGRDVKNVFLSLLGQRNYVVAPMTEEFVFRACMIAILYHAGWSLTSLVYISPMFFGLAHLHHAWEKYHQWGAGAKALKLVVISSLFQFCYTTVFGWYVSFVFLRLGSIWPPIVCHTFCNIMGFPDISEIQLQAPAKRAVIMCSFVMGAFLFYWLLYSFTDPLSADGSLYWPAA